jgi:hypothetical protein
VNPDELRQLLKCEDDRTEWKQTPKDKDDILRAVCALANDLEDRLRERRPVKASSGTRIGSICQIQEVRSAARAKESLGPTQIIATR